MFDRLKRALADSYVGAIALGYLFAQGVLHFVNIFASPIAGWVSRREYGGLLQHGSTGTELPGFSLKDGLPEAVRFLLLLLVWLALFHWLYLKPIKDSSEPPKPEQHN